MIHYSKQAMTSYTSNILDVYNVNPTNGKEWYFEANQFAAYLSGISNGLQVEQTAGILAALSANTSWAENCVRAEWYVKTGHVGHFKSIIDKCHTIEKTTDVDEIFSILNGRKIQRFFHNILFPDSSPYVTIDRHAYSLAITGKRFLGVKINSTPKRYQFVADCNKKAADIAGIDPKIIQAVSWTNFRQKKVGELN